GLALVADEGGLEAGAGELLVSGQVSRPEAAGGAGALTLLLHGGVEAGLVDRDAVLAADERGEVGGEAVGVVELEGDAPVQAGAARGRQAAELLVEALDARGDRAAEALLLLEDDAVDGLAAGGELGVDVAHHVD